LIHTGALEAFDLVTSMRLIIVFHDKESNNKTHQYITLQGDKHNNKMERMNGAVRDREKTMRGLKKVDTPILTGYQIFHNYIRTHEGLDNKTPAEASGIKIEGENKWITLIENATTQT
jgi:hypothetical protein